MNIPLKPMVKKLPRLVGETGAARRGHAVRYGRQHVHNNVGTIKVQKSGYTIEVTLPILPALARTLAAGPCGDLTFIVGARGRPLTKESFDNEFRDLCAASDAKESARFLRTSAPTSADGIERYLSSGMIRGVGPVYAKKLVRVFTRRAVASGAENILCGAAF